MLDANAPLSQKTHFLVPFFFFFPDLLLSPTKDKLPLNWKHCYKCSSVSVPMGHTRRHIQPPQYARL